MKAMAKATATTQLTIASNRLSNAHLFPFSPACGVLGSEMEVVAGPLTIEAAAETEPLPVPPPEREDVEEEVVPAGAAVERLEEAAGGVGGTVEAAGLELLLGVGAGGVGSGGLVELLAGGVEELLAGGIELLLAGGIEELLAGGIEELLAGGIEELLAGGTEELLAGGTEELLAGGVLSTRFSTN